MNRRRELAIEFLKEKWGCSVDVTTINNSLVIERGVVDTLPSICRRDLAPFVKTSNYKNVYTLRDETPLKEEWMKRIKASDKMKEMTL